LTPSDEISDFAVYSPLGDQPQAGSSRAAASLGPSLEGATIAFVWDHLFRGDEAFELIERELRIRYAGLTFIPHEEFGDIHGSEADENAAMATLGPRMRELNVDGAIVGVGA
jgi:hypothetical protein